MFNKKTSNFNIADITDIHTHILPNVDDGSDSIEDSLNMLRIESNLGVKNVFCTPHYRGEYSLSPTVIKENFEKFKDSVKKEGIDVSLFLGQEIRYSSSFKKDFENGKYLTLNDSKYVLLEFDFINAINIPNVVYDVLGMGLIPVIAHIERYTYVKVEDCYEIKNFGGLIQINADCFSKEGKKFGWKLTQKLFKDDLVDFVASDFHSVRINFIGEAVKTVAQKFGVQKATEVFSENAKLILKG